MWQTPDDEQETLKPDIDLFADPEADAADEDDVAEGSDILGAPVVADVYSADDVPEEEVLTPEVSEALPSETDSKISAEVEAQADMDDDTDVSDTVEAVMAGMKGRIEAALFITNKALSLQELAEIIEARPDDTEMALAELIQDYAFREHCALEIDDTDGYILQVRETAASIVNKMMPLEITPAILRTLSAIAIKSPILQSDLIELRGSTAYDHIAELLARKMITKKRQGRSYILKTTTAFYEYFRLKGDKKELMHLVAQFNPAGSSAPELPDDADPYFASETGSDDSLDEAV